MNGNIILVGVGGAGVSNIAGILRDLGFCNIIGVDAQISQQVEQLRDRGIKIFEHGKYEVKVDDIVIYSSATEKSVEVQRAFELKKRDKKPILIWDYFGFLGEISKYFQTIAITGTNGKSSSSAMAVSVAKDLDLNFGIGIVGALVSDFGGKSYCISKKKTEGIKNIFNFIFTGCKLDYELVKKYTFWVEACEYQRHFLSLEPDWTVITNIELEHTDYFTDFADYENAFVQIAEKTMKEVLVLPNLNSKKILGMGNVEVVSRQNFDFKYLIGEYQNENASLVFGLFDKILDNSIDRGEVKFKIENFTGVWRRMELLKGGGVKIFSDYGHVASSLKLGFQALKAKFPNSKIVCIFQPHQVHRIRQGWNEFPDAMDGYDQKFIYDIYVAREGFSSDEVEKIGEDFANHIGGRYLKTFEDIEKIIKNVEKNSIIVIYSAGDLDFKLRKFFSCN